MGYKVKKIFVGDKQVRPMYWEYNFIGKTLQQIQTDGWTGANMVYYGIDQYGLYGNRVVGIYCPFPLSLASAKKITFTVNGRNGTSGTQNNTVGISTSSTEYKTTGFYVSCNSYGKFNILGVGGNAFTNTTISGTNFSYTGTIDFVNKQIKIQFTQGSTNSFTQSLTDAQITAIRTSSFVNAGVSDTTTPRISYIKIQVEV